MDSLLVTISRHVSLRLERWRESQGLGLQVSYLGYRVFTNASYIVLELGFCVHNFLSPLPPRDTHRLIEHRLICIALTNL